MKYNSELSKITNDIKKLSNKNTNFYQKLKILRENKNNLVKKVIINEKYLNEFRWRFDEIAFSGSITLYAEPIKQSEKTKLEKFFKDFYIDSVYFSNSFISSDSDNCIFIYFKTIYEMLEFVKKYKLTVFGIEKIQKIKEEITEKLIKIEKLLEVVKHEN